MKESVAGLLQQRMDKCTTEQFWAVATLTGLDAFIITQRKDLEVMPPWAILTLVSAVTVYGCYYIIHRHRSYYFYRAALAELLKGEEGIPEFLKKCPPAWKGATLSGVVFYVGWVVGLWVQCGIAYL